MNRLLGVVGIGLLCIVLAGPTWAQPTPFPAAKVSVALRQSTDAFDDTGSMFHLDLHDGQGLIVTLLPEDLGMPGPVTLPVEGSCWTVHVQWVFADGAAVPLEVENLVVDQEGELLAADEFAAAIAEETAAAVFELGLVDQVNLSAGTPGVQCETIGRFRVCRAELPDGRWRMSIFWRNGEGQWQKVYDTGWQCPPEQSGDSSPEDRLARFEALLDQITEAASTTREKAAAFLETWGDELRLLGVSVPALPED